MRRAFALAIAFSAIARAAEAPVIPPGQEALVVQLLGGADALAGCRYEQASIEGATIRARWSCADGTQLAGTLAHPDSPGAAVFKTPKFRVESAGAPWPPAFTEALHARLLAKEDPFRWTVPVVHPGHEEPSPLPRTPWAAVAASAAVLATWLVWRIRARRG